jgi:hypothetical protein
MPSAEASRIRFTSELALSRREELEGLLYFNENQGKVEGRLRETLRHYGSPSMVLGGAFIRFSVPNCPPVQALYALDDPEDAKSASRLAGVAIYTREDVETLSVLFVAVHENYANGGTREGERVAAQLIDVIRAGAERTRGVRWMRLFYHPKDLRIELRRGGR